MTDGRTDVFTKPDVELNGSDSVFVGVQTEHLLTLCPVWTLRNT